MATKAREEPAGAPAAETSHYRVKLDGFKVLVNVPDPRGKPGEFARRHQDYLDIKAGSRGEAIELFALYSGITSTTRQYHVEPISAEQAVAAI